MSLLSAFVLALLIATAGVFLAAFALVVLQSRRDTLAANPARLEQANGQDRHLVSG